MSTFNVHEWNRQRRLSTLNEAEIDAQGNLVGFSGGDWKSKVKEYDHIHFFIRPNQADSLMDKLIMADIDMVDSYPHKGKYLLRVSLGSNAAADLAKAEKIVGQEAKKGSPENETDSSDMWGSDEWGLTNTDDRMNEESTNEVELGRQGAVEIAREQALHDLQDAIDKASEMGSINKVEKFAFDQLLVNAIKRRAKARGDI